MHHTKIKPCVDCYNPYFLTRLWQTQKTEESQAKQAPLLALRVSFQGHLLCLVFFSFMSSPKSYEKREKL